MKAIQRSPEHRAELYHRNFIAYYSKRHVRHLFAKGVRDAEYFRLRHWHELLQKMAARILKAAFDRSDELFDAVVALGDWSEAPNALDPLCAFLVDNDDEMRVWAFRVVTKLIVADDERLTARLWPYVVKGLHDQVAEIQQLMLHSLRIPPNHPLTPDPFESALCALNAPEAPVRCMALRVLREFGPARVSKELDLVVALIKDPAPSVRLSVCELLEWLEVADPAILDLVKKVVARDSDSQVRHAAAVALCKIDPHAKSVDLGPDDDELRRFISGLLKVGKAATVNVGEAATASRPCLEARWRLEERPRLKGLQPVPPELRHVAENASQNVFRERGDEWEIRFRGGELAMLPDLHGLFYISMLVQRPNKGFTPTDLRSARARGRSDADGRTTLGAHSASLEDLARERISRELLTDNQTLKDVSERRRELLAEIDKARDKNDEAEVLRLESDLVELRGYLEQVLKPPDKQTKKRKVRDFPCEAKNNRDAVIKAINTAVKKIEKKDSALAAHFRNSIKFRDLLSYEPEATASWSHS